MVWSVPVVQAGITMHRPHLLLDGVVCAGGAGKDTQEEQEDERRRGKGKARRQGIESTDHTFCWMVWSVPVVQAGQGGKDGDTAWRQG